MESSNDNELNIDNIQIENNEGEVSIDQINKKTSTMRKIIHKEFNQEDNQDIHLQKIISQQKEIKTLKKFRCKGILVYVITVCCLLLIISLISWSLHRQKKHIRDDYEKQQEIFNLFVALYGKHYNGQELEIRFELFLANLLILDVFLKIQQINPSELSDLEILSYLSLFADQSMEEMSQKFGYIPDLGPSTSYKSLGAANITKIDWRITNKVSSVKDQGNCGSCWAFATVSAIESGYAIATYQNAKSLSVQQFLDCNIQNEGCEGGNIYQALQYAYQNTISTEANYPYTGIYNLTKSCQFYSGSQANYIRAFYRVPKNNNTELKAAVSKQPVIATIDATWLAQLNSTKNIIFDDKMNKYICSDQTNHAILLVGFEKDYYIAKNSWGTQWGDNGYFKIKMADGTGVCGLNTQAYYPVF